MDVPVNMALEMLLDSAPNYTQKEEADTCTQGFLRAEGRLGSSVGCKGHFTHKTEGP